MAIFAVILVGMISIDTGKIHHQPCILKFTILRNKFKCCQLDLEFNFALICILIVNKLELLLIAVKIQNNAKHYHFY